MRGKKGDVFLSTEFVISDQQGNARLSFDNSGSGGTAKVRQENSYYAFGMVMPNSPVSLPGNDNKKLYNGGSEWQKDFGNKPDYYQTFYRNYDAALGRWISVDPEAESAESMTVYQYGGNNPVMMNDPLGNKAKWDFSYQAGGSGSTFGQADFAAGQAADEAFNQIYGNIGGGGGGGGGDYSAFWDSALSFASDVIDGMGNSSPASAHFSGRDFATGAGVENGISNGRYGSAYLNINGDGSMNISASPYMASNGQQTPGIVYFNLNGSNYHSSQGGSNYPTLPQEILKPVLPQVFNRYRRPLSYRKYLTATPVLPQVFPATAGLPACGTYARRGVCWLV